MVFRLKSYLCLNEKIRVQKGVDKSLKVFLGFQLESLWMGFHIYAHFQFVQKKRSKVTILKYLGIKMFLHLLKWNCCPVNKSKLQLSTKDYITISHNFALKMLPLYVWSPDCLNLTADFPHVVTTKCTVMVTSNFLGLTLCQGALHRSFPNSKDFKLSLLVGNLFLVKFLSVRRINEYWRRLSLGSIISLAFWLYVFKVHRKHHHALKLIGSSFT